MVKPLTFKGEKKSKKRKAPHSTSAAEDPSSTSPSSANAVIALNQPTTHQNQYPTNTSSIDDDDSWVSAEAPTDIIGPVVLLFSSVPPVCIACDQNGKVYASEIENIIEGQAATAEPHDMRQVWIATRVAGTEKISFKGHHGRYLNCDKFGILSAHQEAISPEESFLCILSAETSGGGGGATFNIQSEYEKYLAVRNDIKKGAPDIRGDAELTSSDDDSNNNKPNNDTGLHIRMQARFKPKLKASKASKAREKISRKELEEVVGRRLDDDEVRKLKRARVQGDYHEAILDVRVKGKHDKYA